MSVQGEFVVVDDSQYMSILYSEQPTWYSYYPFSTDVDVDAVNETVTYGYAGATASFTFTGTTIAVLGYVAKSIPSGTDGTPPIIQFSLDNQATHPVQPTTPDTGGLQWESVWFFVQTNLSAVSHTLDIYVYAASKDYPFILDALEYAPSNPSVAPSGSLVSTSIPVSTSILVSTSTFVSTSISYPTAVATPSSSSLPSKASAPVGAIVGGIIGGLAVLIATGFATYFFCFRRRDMRPFFYATSADPADLLEQETKPTPYELPPPSVATPSSAGSGSQHGSGSQSTLHNDASAMSTAPSAYSASVSDGPVSEYSAGSSGAQSHSSRLHLVGGNVRKVHPLPGQGYSKAAEAGLLSIGEELQTTYHADSGVRFDANGEPSSSSTNVLTDVPPSYSQM